MHLNVTGLQVSSALGQKRQKRLTLHLVVLLEDHQQLQDFGLFQVRDHYTI